MEEHLKEGKVYKIRQVVVFRFMSCNKWNERVAFRLEGIVPHLIQGTEYAFFHGRFKPLQPDDEDEDIDISIFLDDLWKVNSGLIRFDDEVTRELETIDARR